MMDIDINENEDLEYKIDAYGNRLCCLKKDKMKFFQTAPMLIFGGSKTGKSTFMLNLMKEISEQCTNFLFLTKTYKSEDDANSIHRFIPKCFIKESLDLNVVDNFIKTAEKTYNEWKNSRNPNNLKQFIDLYKDYFNDEEYNQYCHKENLLVNLQISTTEKIKDNKNYDINMQSKYDNDFGKIRSWIACKFISDNIVDLENLLENDENFKLKFLKIMSPEPKFALIIDDFTDEIKKYKGSGREKEKFKNIMTTLGTRSRHWNLCTIILLHSADAFDNATFTSFHKIGFMSLDAVKDFKSNSSTKHIPNKDLMMNIATKIYEKFSYICFVYDSIESKNYNFNSSYYTIKCDSIQNYDYINFNFNLNKLVKFFKDSEKYKMEIEMSGV